MGSGGQYHGSTSNTKTWDEMTPEEKEAYLAQRRLAEMRQREYLEEQRRRKKRNAILIGIGLIILLALIITLIVYIKNQIK